ncbi:hypothetical protein [Lentzea sp. NPDC092896]|uniref:hypothetical protein n=1 Tax=Lentzea sp. NPDC092896 TaxID=3364127 RepID=UPI0037F9E9C9
MDPAASKPVERLVADGLTGATSEQVEKYIDWLQASLADFTKEKRRRSFLLITLAAVFELLAAGGQSEIVIGPLKISQPSVVLVFMPTLAAYVFTELMIVHNKTHDLLDALCTSMRAWHGTAHANALAYLTVGPEPLLWNTSILRGHLGSKPKRGKAEERLSTAIVLLVILGLLAFLVHAFVVLFQRLGPGSVLIWVNLAGTSTLIVAAFDQLRVD